MLTIPPEYREWIRKIQRVLSHADGILRTLFHARDGSFWEKVLVGAALASDALDYLTPYRSAGDALRDAGYTPLSTGIGAFLYSLLHDTQTPVETVLYSQGEDEDDQTEILYYSLPNLPRAVAVVREQGAYAEGPLVREGNIQVVRDLIRAYAWASTDREVKSGGSMEAEGRSRGRRRAANRPHQAAGSPFQVAAMPPVSRYIGDPPLSWYSNRLMAYRKMEVVYHRTIRLVGPSGVGKTTLARVLGKAMLGPDAKTLRISSHATRGLSQHDLFDLVDLVAPDVFIIDDYKSMGEDVEGGDLSFLEALHDRIPLTVLTTMDEEGSSREARVLGMRPGRVDETFVLEEPKAGARHGLLETFLGEASLTLPPKQLDQLVERTEGMTGAYIEELVRRIAVHGIDSWATEANKLGREIDVFSNRRRLLRRRRVAAIGKSERAVVKGALNPKARVADLRAWCFKHKAKPSETPKTRAAWVAAVQAALATKAKKTETATSPTSSANAP